MTGWVCSDCGGDRAKPIEDPKFGRMTQFDDRYNVGYCDDCNDPNPTKPRKTPRPTHPLVRADVFDRAKWEEKREREKLKTLIQMFAAGKDKVQMSDIEVERLVTLYDKYQPPGFVVPGSIREAADAYRKSTKGKR